MPAYIGSLILESFTVGPRLADPPDWLCVDPLRTFSGAAVITPGVRIPNVWWAHRSAFRLLQVSQPRVDPGGILRVSFSGEVPASVVDRLAQPTGERDVIEREIVPDILVRLGMMPGPHHKAAPLPPKEPYLAPAELELLRGVYGPDPSRVKEGDLSVAAQQSTAPTPHYEERSIPSPIKVQKHLVPAALKGYVDPLPPGMLPADWKEQAAALGMVPCESPGEPEELAKQVKAVLNANIVRQIAEAVDLQHLLDTAANRIATRPPDPAAVVTTRRRRRVVDV